MFSFIAFLTIIGAIIIGYQNMNYFWVFALAVAAHPANLLRSEAIFHRHMESKDIKGMTTIMLTCYVSSWIRLTIIYWVSFGISSLFN